MGCELVSVYTLPLSLSSSIPLSLSLSLSPSHLPPGRHQNSNCVYIIIFSATQEAQKIFPAKYPIEKEPTGAMVGGCTLYMCIYV